MKKRYLEMRKSGNFDISWFYEYYVKNFSKVNEKSLKTNPNPLPFEIFYQIFTPIFQMDPQPILIPLDKEFELRYIEDKNGNIVKFM